MRGDYFIACAAILLFVAISFTFIYASCAYMNKKYPQIERVK